MIFKQNKRGLSIFSLCIAILLISAYFIYVLLSYPYIGVSVKTNQFGQTEITEVDPMSWGYQKGINNGDIVTSINSGLPTEHFSVSKYNIIEKIESMEIIHNDQVIQLIVDKTIDFKHLSFQLWLPAILLLADVLLCMFIYLNMNPECG